MKRRTALISLSLGAMALFPALAPGPGVIEDTKLKSIATEKAAIARKIVDFYADVRLAPPGNLVESQGIPGLEQVEFWTRRLVDSRLEATTVPAERIAILAEDVERTKALAARIKELAEQRGAYGKLDGFKADYLRLDAEYRLIKEQGGN